MSQGPDLRTPRGPTAGEPSPPQTPIPPRERAASVFSNAALMLFGAVLAGGGWWLARLWAPPPPPGEINSPAAASPGVDPDEFRKLAGRVDALKTQDDATAKKVVDAPGLDPDVKKLRDQLADLSRTVGDLPSRFETLDKKIDAESKALAVAPSPRMDAIEKRVVDLAQAIELLKDEVKARPKSLTQAAPVPGPDEKGIELAVESFKQGKYAEADAAFARLRATAADDARLWYYAALSRGLDTREWTGETERLVLAGMEREKAGSPSVVAIDKTFSQLTPATGKDWLAAYRKRIAPR